MTAEEKLKIEERIVEVLKTVYDKSLQIVAWRKPDTETGRFGKGIFRCRTDHGIPKAYS